jgi:uncharacterized protein YifE (UPF0438 family)
MAEFGANFRASQFRSYFGGIGYACGHCNQIKARRIALDPCRIAYGRCVQVLDSGEIKPRNREGERLIAVLKLDSPLYTSWRAHWINSLRRLPQEEIPRWFRFPDDLPDLEALNKTVSKNTRPQGVVSCFYARRRAGTIPAIC